MDGSLAIEANREALKRIVAMLVEMAGLADDAHGDVEPRKTIPRILWRAILALLRPAESAARRLIIAASRGLTAPPPRLRQPKPATMEPLLRRFGIAVMVERGGQSAVARRAKAEGGRARHSLPLFDPPRRLSGRHHTIPPHAAPRIFVPGFTEPAALPPPPACDDRVNSTRLTRRLEALSAALDDLPGQARRFARLQARLNAEHAHNEATPRRVSPIRRGRPPGGRLSRYDPSRTLPPNIREVDEILAHAHSLALYALENPDTS